MMHAVLAMQAMDSCFSPSILVTTRQNFELTAAKLFSLRLGLCLLLFVPRLDTSQRAAVDRIYCPARDRVRTRRHGRVGFGDEERKRRDGGVGSAWWPRPGRGSPWPRTHPPKGPRNRVSLLSVAVLLTATRILM